MNTKRAGCFWLSGLLVFSLSCATAPKKEEPKQSWDSVFHNPEAKGHESGAKPKSAKPKGEALTGDNVYLPERSLDEYSRMASILTTQVVLSRGLAQRDQLKLSMLQDVAFEDAIESTRGGRVNADRERSAAAEIFAFGFAPLDDPPRPVGAKEKKEEKGQKYRLLIGLYDPDKRVMHVRTHGRANNAEDEDTMRQTMAHEIEHALQHQNLRMIDLPSIADMDTLQAVKAVYEGDAEFARVLSNYPEALFSIRNTRIVLGGHSALVRTSSKMSRRLRELGFSESIAGASRFSREMQMFPYEQGFVFLARIYMSGGMELVNKVFAHPPSTTEQVLHPEKYVAGEGSIAVPIPALPASSTSLATGRLGELGIRILLEECATAEQAANAAAGWGGDAWRVSQDAEGHVALSWNTAWDGEADAQQFADLVSDRKECWGDTVTKKYQWSISHRFSVKRTGTVVSVVRGLPAKQERAELAELSLFRPKEPKVVTTLGDVQLAPDAYEGIEDAIANESGDAGILKGRRYEHKRMGIKVELPESVAARVDTESGAITVATNTEPGALGQVLLINTKGDDTAADILAAGPGSWSRTVFGKVDESVKELSKGKLKVALDQKMTLPLGEGRMRRWLVAQDRQIEAVFVPICDGKAAYTFLLRWQTGEELSLLDRWMRAFRLSDGPVPPVCKELE